MKLHSHKFLHEFADGNRCVMKVTRCNRIKMRWDRKPNEGNLDEYRDWRRRIINAVHPGLKVLVVEC